MYNYSKLKLSIILNFFIILEERCTIIKRYVKNVCNDYNKVDINMSNIEIFNETDKQIEELDIVKKVLEYAVKKEKLNNVEFNVIIVDNSYIHNLNKNYRNIDKETDVITFALDDEDKVVTAGDIDILGDIYISVDKAIEQAKEYNHSFLREITFLAVHGFYHLLGYDHMTKEDEKVMFEKQEAVLNECEIKREK